MGSFNETCALSNLNIGCGTPVRLLFLTQNPYVRCDQHEQHRGCYSTDQWFVRTPPIKGIYDDYGNAKFTEGPITELISKCFQADVIERPFGFNQYHTADVTKTKGIHHFLQAAWQGRLLVQDDYTRTRKAPPSNFPTWQKVHALFKTAKLPIQSEVKDGGYNAQPIIPGVVCVTFNSYGDNSRKLKRAEKVLVKEYDCRIRFKFIDRKDDPCLIVAPKGAFKKFSILHDNSVIAEALNTHPEMNRDRYRQLPVLAVMIREDVWQAYCTVKSSRHGPNTVPLLLESFQKLLSNEDDRGKLRKYIGLDPLHEMLFQRVLFSIPFQTTACTHLTAGLIDPDFAAKDELLLSCAELARVEQVMESLHHSWHIPPLGGQDGAWALRTQLLSDITAISKKELKREESENED